MVFKRHEDIRLPIPVEEYDSLFASVRRRSLWMFLGVFVVGTALSAGLASRFTRPIRRLDAGIRRLSAGDLEVQVPARGGDEIARLGTAFNDMTRSLRANRQRSREMVRREKHSALGRLAAGVAHDIRNPLHSIGLTLQHLRETCRPEAEQSAEEFDRSLDIIRGEIRRLDQLVGNFLRFAKSEARERHEVDLRGLLTETARLVQKEAEWRRVEVELDLDESAPSIEADGEAIRSSILNLVLNSFEAMPDGGRLHLSLRTGDEAAVLEVADTGEGIPPQDQDRVFDFAYTTKEGGNGLGLAMVYQCIVEDHGGQVSLEQRPRRGDARPHDVAAPRRLERGGRGLSTKKTGEVAPRARLLVVDDEEPQRVMLANILGRAGFEVVTAANGGEALARLKESRFDLMLTDQRMPSMDGLELLERVRRTRQELPIILMTAYGTVSTAVEAMKRGASDYLTKPFERDELLVVIEKAIRHRRLEDEVVSLRGALRERYHLDNLVGGAPSMQAVFALIERVSVDRRPGADHRRQRHGQGTGGAGDSPEQPSGQRSVRGPELRRRAGDACSRASSSATSAAPSPVPRGRTRDASSRPTAARCSSTRSAPCAWTCRPSCCARSRRARFSESVRPSTRKVDVRILAASCEDLEQAIRNRTFREDLYYRLNVVPIVLPPLRDRVEDIRCSSITSSRGRRRNSAGKGSASPRKCWTGCSGTAWPGNVRELENCIERMVVLTRSDRLTADDVPSGIGIPGEAASGNLDGFELPGAGIRLPELEKHLIQQALRRTRGHLRPAASLLGISYKTLQYRLRKHDLDREAFHESFAGLSEEAD